MSMRVALDVTTAVTQRAGIGRYTRELVRALLALEDGPELRPFFAAPRAGYPLDGAAPATHLRRGIRSWRLEMLLRLAARRAAPGPWDSAQVYHAPDVIFCPTRNVPVVTTVHDLSYVIYPRFHTRLNGAFLRRATPLAVRRADAVIAVSEATKRDLIAAYGVPEARIHVVHTGIAAPFIDPPGEARIDETRRRLGLTAPFILSVGTLEPRKNLHGIVAAYRALRAALPDAPDLALVGGSGWRLDEGALFGPRDAAHIRRTGFVDDDDLAALYASCVAFLYPSLYEGWGLPIAEAMSLGAPVVTSNVSSLPEVAGDAALLVDPREPEQIAGALERLLTDSELAGRLRREGRARAQQFSTQAWARATMQVYRTAVE